MPNYTLLAEPGIMSFFGEPATMQQTGLFPVGTGSFAFAGQQVTFTLGYTEVQANAFAFPVRFISMLAVNPQGAPPFVLVGPSNAALVATLDTLYPAKQKFVLYKTHIIIDNENT